MKKILSCLSFIALLSGNQPAQAYPSPAASEPEMSHPCPNRFCPSHLGGPCLGLHAEVSVPLVTLSVAALFSYHKKIYLPVVLWTALWATYLGSSEVAHYCKNM